MKKTHLVWAIVLLTGLFAGTLQADIMVRDKKANIIYQYSNGVMYKGRASQNRKLFTFNNRGGDTKTDPAFCFTKNGFLYKGGKPAADKLAMSLDWFNCYAPGKKGTDAIGTLQYTGENILTEGYTKRSPRPDFTGKRILLSSTLPNNKVPMIKRLFLIYLTQLDPDFKAYCSGRK